MSTLRGAVIGLGMCALAVACVMMVMYLQDKSKASKRASRRSARVCSDGSKRCTKDSDLERLCASRVGEDYLQRQLELS